MIPGSFEYYRPNSVDEALSILAEHGDEGRLLAGGQSLIAMMKLKMAMPTHVIDMKDIDGLSGIADKGDHLEIGAMTTQADVLASELLAERCPILLETAALIADPQVRYLGTVGGNVANGDPGNDMPAIMMCLGASYVLKNTTGERVVAARDFYEAAYFTALEEGEMLTAIRIPAPNANHGSSYQKLKRKVGDYATAATAVVLVMESGKCTHASVALTNLSDTALYVEDAVQALVGTAVDDAAIAKAVEAVKAVCNPVGDLKGSVEYRIAMAGVMTDRAIRSALERAKG